LHDANRRHRCGDSLNGTLLLRSAYSAVGRRTVYEPTYYEVYSNVTASEPLSSYKAMSDMMIKKSLVKISKDSEHPPGPYQSLGKFGALIKTCT
jgi:hypothetical protein